MIAQVPLLDASARAEDPRHVLAHTLLQEESLAIWRALGERGPATSAQDMFLAPTASRLTLVGVPRVTTTDFPSAERAIVDVTLAFAVT